MSLSYDGNVFVSVFLFSDYKGKNLDQTCFYCFLEKKDSRDRKEKTEH